MIKNIDYIKLRRLWYQFFETKKHFFINTVDLVPKDDKSLLWTNSGIAGIKNYFSGIDTPPAKKLVNIQKCLRTNDLNNVGITLRHHTFFEMMGFFSLGDYFKKEAIEMSWEFLTSSNWLDIDPKWLYVTIYEKDLETEKIWLNNIKILPSHLVKCSKNLNFWEIGEGPCGPNTEIFYDRGSKHDTKKIGTKLLKEDIENDRFLEVWNIVFSDFFYNKEKNEYKPLPSKNIDTGVGYERLLAVLEKKDSNFDTSLFSQVKSLIIDKSTLNSDDFLKHENIVLLRKLCDFSRAITFIIVENVIPTNKDRGYVLKNLIKLSVFVYSRLCIPFPFLSDLISEYQYIYDGIYSELKKINADVLQMIFDYEERIYLDNKNIFKIEKEIKKIISHDAKDEVFWEEERFFLMANLFSRLNKFYLPYDRFKQLETYGKWSFQNEELYKSFFSFLYIFLSDSNRYSILMPPPNITGKLHLGHALELCIQDIIIKEQKLAGKDCLLLPGLDHAGIATQVLLEKKISQDIDFKNTAITRSKFIKYANKWKIENEKNIINQWDSLGIVPNYNLLTYTMNSKASQHVNWAFKILYNDGLIYRAKKIINWDIKLKTAISDIEIEYRFEEKKLYFIKYFLTNSNDYLLVATTRPETIFADVCLFVNPKDKRYIKYIGKKVINPLTNLIIPVLADNYVDITFGSGVLKCTPAHDINDYELMIKHKLPIIECINKAGKLNTTVPNEYRGLSINDARQKVIEFFKAKSIINKVVDYKSKTAYSQRTNTIIELLITEQWFIKLNKLAQNFLFLQEKFPSITILPERFKNTIHNWLTNSKDWCISRQIWWGHRIPVWYDKNDQSKIIAVGEKPKNNNVIQDEDVLDTWFSSSLWPLITLDYLNNKKLFEQYFPFTTLITGYDILFFWVCRMILVTSYLLNKNNENKNKNKPLENIMPFQNIYFHGLVRDKNGLKMSKSNNNGIDPLTIVDKYGFEALRLFFALNHTPGLDINFHENKVAKQKYLIIKLENVGNFISLKIDDFNLDLKNHQLKEANYTYYSDFILISFKKFMRTIFKNNFAFRKNPINFINIKMYQEIIDYFIKDFCAKYLEGIKASLLSEILTFEQKQQELHIFIYIYNELLLLLNPLLPITTFRIFLELNNNFLYTNNSLLHPKRFYELNENKLCNFVTNKKNQYFNYYVNVNDDMTANIFSDIWFKISKFASATKNKSPIYYVIKNMVSHNNDNKAFLQSYIKKYNVNVTSEAIIYQYNCFQPGHFQEIRTTFYDKKAKTGAYIVYYGYFTPEFIEYIIKHISNYQIKVNNEINILANKIEYLDSTINKIKELQKINILKERITYFVNKKNNLRNILQRFESFKQKIKK